MNDNLSDFLSAGEIRDLALCGITTPDQLKKVKAETLWQDLQKAQEFFPDHRLTLTQSRLARICGEGAAEAAPVKRYQQSATWANLDMKARGQVLAQMKYPHQVEEAEAEEEDDDDITEDDEQLGLPIKKAQHVSGLSKSFHAVHCTHSWLTYFGALATVLLIPAICCLGIVPTMLLQGIVAEPIHLVYAGAACFVLMLPYIIYSRITTCSVCHMRIFSFKNYGRNRAAHHLPILGYTIPTALHILLFFQYRCPACGTTQKLFARSRHRHRH